MIEINICYLNLCRYEGKCLVLDENSFMCNCENIGYKGSKCEIGFVNMLIFLKLCLNISFKVFVVVVCLLKCLRVFMILENGVIIYLLLIEILFLKRKEVFIVEGVKLGI